MNLPRESARQVGLIAADAVAKMWTDEAKDQGGMLHVSKEGRGKDSVHRAKGLEFDHVAVLGGGWNRVRPGEDPDAQRRLYYVAMTRARSTLLLARSTNDPPALQDGLAHHPAVLRREPIPIQPPSPAMEYHHLRAGPGDVDLGFAGRRSSTDPVHAAMAALSPGDPLTTRIRPDDGRWELLNAASRVVGRLARKFQPPTGMRCRSATVLAVIVRSRAQAEPNFQPSIQCDAWEVVVPELVFEPER